jgi:hypothetical protein
MKPPSENQGSLDSRESLMPEAPSCGLGCGGKSSNPSSRIRVFLGVVILVAAAVLTVRALTKDQGSSPDKTEATFAAAPVSEGSSAPASGGGNATSNSSRVDKPVGEEEINALADLNAVAAATGGVFVYLPGEDNASGGTTLSAMRSAAKTIEDQSRVKIGVFTLKTASRDYGQIAAQMAVPGVLAIVKGKGAIPVTGEITETKLVQGFVAASSAGGCGPAAQSGCCPK